MLPVYFLYYLTPRRKYILLVLALFIVLESVSCESAGITDLIALGKGRDLALGNTSDFVITLDSKMISYNVENGIFNEDKGNLFLVERKSPVSSDEERETINGLHRR